MKSIRIGNTNVLNMFKLSCWPAKVTRMRRTPFEVIVIAIVIARMTRSDPRIKKYDTESKEMNDYNIYVVTDRLVTYGPALPCKYSSIRVILMGTRSLMNDPSTTASSACSDESTRIDTQLRYTKQCMISAISYIIEYYLPHLQSLCICPC